MGDGTDLVRIWHEHFWEILIGIDEGWLNRRTKLCTYQIFSRNKITQAFLKFNILEWNALFFFALRWISW